METIIGIGKELVQTPEGVKKGILIVLRAALTMYMAIQLGFSWMHELKDADFYSFTLASAPILLQHLVLVVFTILAVWFLIELLMHIPGYMAEKIGGLLGRLFNKKIVEHWEEIIMFWLRILKVADYLEVEKKVIPGKNVHLLEDIREFGEVYLDLETFDFRESGVCQGLGLIFVSWLEFTVLWPLPNQPVGLNWLFCFSAGLLSFLVACLGFVIVVVAKGTNPVFSTNSFLSTKRLIEQEFLKLRHQLYHSPLQGIEYEFVYNEKKILVGIWAKGTIATRESLEETWEVCKSSCDRFVIIALDTPSPAAFSFAKKTYGRLILIDGVTEVVVKDAFSKHFG